MRTVREEGTAATSLAEMKVKVLEHFGNLYNCDACPAPNVDFNFSTVISLEVNAWLRAFPREEVAKHALFSMPKNKSPGPDGVTAEIFQYHWELVKRTPWE